MILAIRSQVEGVLGTRLDLHADVIGRRFGGSEKVRAHIESVVLAEIDRLELVFSVYNENSELRQWRAAALPGTNHQVSPELASLLVLSSQWQRMSKGAYNPAIGVVFDHWRQAASTGVVPSPSQTDDWAGELAAMTYSVDGTSVHCVGDCTGLTFNSLAKGWIADRAATMLTDLSDSVVRQVGGVTINLGGDLRTINRALRVGIEHPTRPYDNEPPICVIEVTNGGVATSGASRRPIVIGGQRFSHIIDPRTCRPVDNDVGSVTVVADNAATADVVATMVAVTGDLLPDYAIAISSVGSDPVEVELTTTSEFDNLVVR
jgi:FAD:protein FMN transferase